MTHEFKLMMKQNFIFYWFIHQWFKIHVEKSTSILKKIQWSSHYLKMFFWCEQFHYSYNTYSLDVPVDKYFFYYAMKSKKMLQNSKFCFQFLFFLETSFLFFFKSTKADIKHYFRSVTRNITIELILEKNPANSK